MMLDHSFRTVESLVDGLEPSLGVLVGVDSYTEFSKALDPK
jgi:hypothetical protein